MIASRLCGKPLKVIEMLDSDDGSEVLEIAVSFFARCLGGWQEAASGSGVSGFRISSRLELWAFDIDELRFWLERAERGSINAVADKETKLSIVIATVDAATAKIKAINERLERVTKPVTDLKKAMGELREKSGLDDVIGGFKGVGEAVGDAVRQGRR